MARTVPAEELDLIEKLISKYPDGIGISALEETITNHVPNIINRRTLQRRLKRLLTDKRIISKGKGQFVIYKASPRTTNMNRGLAESSKKGGTEFYVPLSEDGAIIRNLIRRPILHRKPIGYNQSFLFDYDPGITFYLPESLRAHLHKIGRTPANERPAGSYARDILNRLLIDLSWASSSLEGNTYNQLETRNLIEFGQAAEGKDILETQMILNHKAAIELLIEEADQINFTPFTFYNLHAILSENLLSDETACGRLRSRLVDISGSVFHPLGIPQVLEDCFRLLLEKASTIPDPFEQAFFVMVHIPYLQPFEDVNKRVSRLGANIPLIKNNLCPLSFIDVPEQAYVEGTLGVYELNQIDLLLDVFTWAYERSCQRYLAISKTVPEPNPLRIRYREDLIVLVQKIVRKRQKPSLNNIRRLTHERISAVDRDAFLKIALNDLQNMHEGNVARYRLKLSDYQSWIPVRDKYFQPEE